MPDHTAGRAEIERLAQMITGRRVAVLTGAGMSTDSGIPDYRGPGSPPRTPMTFQQFIGDAAFRQRYWARNHVGWRRMDAARPNAGHRALARLERLGVVSGLITQNVDLLHTKAGHRRVIDLHGTYARVRCLSCDHLVSRMSLAERLEAANPGFADAVEVTGVEVAPDADAVIADTAAFRMVGCVRCGGILKPDIVYFGENVPKDRVRAAYDVVDDAEVLLVAGSSLTVMSGLRFVRHAAKSGTPVIIVNRGRTRGDEFAGHTVDAGCSPTLSALADHLTAQVAV
ncbi:NAD-dependent protein deacetylase [Nocardia cyriacigeorgica]|uniref:NAD-dependent protein deacetylase n=1 Tax=Nocardia cyriacigeorgica TaxID=135487 RepID=UPI0018933DFC|nr:NAD-dependent protein deacetylase [Nocardia cyriacigeorgica]MBF6098669.1 NAD-dependent protein deacetylase [Nocardia cyriacigeorgica]MBF6162424.1 NAD-dependent protein deacetylase [Nocardia cyriacigeorgica]MBF6201383.1 NAD-dependent protein deacetylase [Nocardia cyriacigeorgica]MBF6320692.1 NAD-dependent protein deacetylase [Nocardia cyriacigeorgica]MBF6514500.1 NAD-dependent protein deacetylase [Nocardia cyriacigeorgica]